MAAAEQARERDDRVLPMTRWVSFAIVPFLVVAFAVLVPWPTDTGRLFAWDIEPTLTPMILGSVYLGGAYFFVRAARAQHWHTVKGGFVPVGTFATLMGVATIAHWDKFLHTRPAFWLWAGLYFTTPILIFWVWTVNRRRDAPAAGSDLLLPARDEPGHRRRRGSLAADERIPVPAAGSGRRHLAVGADAAHLPGPWRDLLARHRGPRRSARPPVVHREDPAPGRRADACAHHRGWRACQFRVRSRATR